MAGGTQGGPRFPWVTSRLAAAATSEAGSRGLRLAPSAMDAIGGLVSRAALTLEDESLLTDEKAVSHAEQSIRRVIHELPARGIERRGGATVSPPPVIDDDAVFQAMAGLCPGLWPIC